MKTQMLFDPLKVDLSNYPLLDPTTQFCIELLDESSTLKAVMAMQKVGHKVSTGKALTSDERAYFGISDDSDFDRFRDTVSAVLSQNQSFRIERF